jgi:hypothetical protein
VKRDIRPFGAALSRGTSPVLALSILCLGATPLMGQSEQRDTSIANLPRPGYEPRTLTAGGFLIVPSLEADTTYNDNIFATPDRRRGDTIFDIQPRVTGEMKRSTFDLKTDVHADLIRYANTPRENVNTFGTKFDATKSFGANQTLNATLTYDRTYERRSDPEADFDRSLPPALINLATGDLSYAYKGGRIGVIAHATVNWLDYLPTVDADRDLMTYRASVRGLLNVTQRVAVYIEPFVNRRDARLRVDRSGIDRDTTTSGALAGLSFDITDRLQGNIGAGVFASDPDDRRLKSFTGVAASGRIVWHPRVRTTVVADVFRGDVATIRTGAIGRIDTRAGISIDQEARHNLILHGGIGIDNIHYRGSIDRDQRYVSGTAEARYLMNRYFTLILNTVYTHRGADQQVDRFHRWQSQLGIRFAY